MSLNNFERILAVISDAEVQFVIIGGVAASAHGSAQLTRDLDICYQRTVENVRRLVAALTPLHPRLRGAPADLPFIFDERTILRGFNFTLSTDLGAVDLLGEVQGLGDYTAVAAASGPMDLFGRQFKVLLLQGLIRSKRSAGRPRDLAILPELEALLEIEVKTKADPSGGTRS